jgi:hypothetical protein
MERTRDKTVYMPVEPVDTEPEATRDMMVQAQGESGTIIIEVHSGQVSVLLSISLMRFGF